MDRPALQPWIFGLAYFAAAAGPIVAFRLEGGVALFWIASALLTAKLRTTDPTHWKAYLVAAGMASLLATGLLGLGWLAAPALMVLNLIDSLFATKVLAIIEKRRGAISIERDGPLLVLACLLGAFVTAVPAAAVTHLVTGTSFTGNTVNWLISHTLGSLTFGPFMAYCMRGEMRPWMARMLRCKDLPSLGVILLLCVTSLIAFNYDTMTLLFLPVLALVLLAYRTGLQGAALGCVLLGVIGLTSILIGTPASEFGDRVATFQFFLFFLASTTLIVLPIAAAVSARRAMTQRLVESEDGYRMLADNIEDIVFSCDLRGRLTYVSPSIRTINGSGPAGVLGQSALTMIDPRFHDQARQGLREMIRADGHPVTVEFVGKTNGEYERWFELRGRCAGDAGEARRVIGTIRETTMCKVLENALTSAVEADSLTGLMNRGAFFRAADATASNSSDACWLAVFDLDHITAINTVIGNDAGDLVLTTFASVARQVVRSKDILGRLEDDAFALLLPNTSADQAQVVCERLLAAFAGAHIVHAGRPIVASASAGVAALANDLDASVQAARKAVVAAKKSGGAILRMAA
jgi:diguanylate cyclase (GGDEF)-like protein/PAS domain S-box-containing protein